MNTFEHINRITGATNGQRIRLDPFLVGGGHMRLGRSVPSRFGLDFPGLRAGATDGYKHGIPALFPNVAAPQSSAGPS
jgi:hypothetical protein